jgi:hypothetical protein
MKLPLGKNLVLTAAALGTVALFCGFGGNAPAVGSSQSAAPIVYVSAPVYDPLAALKGEERFPQGGQIFFFDNATKKSSLLVPGFFAAVDPNVSFDAKSLLFSGKKSAGDAWQIYEMKLASREVRAVFAVAEDEKPTDLIRPLYLPQNRLVYTRRTASGFALEAAQLNGTKIMPLSAIPASALPVDVLEDGRVLFESNYPLGMGATPELFLVYSDGSGVESYRCDHPGEKEARFNEPDASSFTGRWGGHQSANGDVLFTHGESLARFTSALKEEASLDAPKIAYSDGPVEFDANTWLLSATTAKSKHFSLTLYSPASKSVHLLVADGSNDLVEPVLLAARTAPHQHPSGLHDWKYGNFLALDVRTTRDAPLAGEAVTVRMQALDTDGKVVELGSAPVESDGSFFVQTTGNTPVRFILEDKAGHTLRAERGWIWIAKGEQRICVGCHQGPERASENKVPAVLLRTTTPADLNLKATSQTQKSDAAGEN